MQFPVRFFGSFWSLSSLVPHMLIISHIAFTFRISDGTSNLVICLFLSYGFLSFSLSFWTLGFSSNDMSLRVRVRCFLFSKLFTLNEWEYAQWEKCVARTLSSTSVQYNYDEYIFYNVFRILILKKFRHNKWIYEK